MFAFNRFQRTALLTTLTTYVLIGVGGLVRASGAGLGCPDWPQCFGLWIPPISLEQLPSGFDSSQFNVIKTWTEYLNRLLGALTGVLILATMVLAIRDHFQHRRVVWSSFAAFICVLLNGWLGGKVVQSHLAPWILTAHLILALVLVSLLLYATVNAFYGSDESMAVEVSASRIRLGRATAVTIGVLGLQIAAGALLRGQVQEVAKLGVAREAWLAHVGWVEIVHSSGAPLVAGLVLWVSALAWSEQEIRLQRVALASVILVAMQACAGYGLRAWDFPPSLQVVHLWFAALLLGVLSLQQLLVWRLVPSMTGETLLER